MQEHYNYYEKQGLDKKEIIKKIAKDRNVNKNDIYMEFLEWEMGTHKLSHFSETTCVSPFLISVAYWGFLCKNFFNNGEKNWKLKEKQNKYTCNKNIIF